MSGGKISSLDLLGIHDRIAKEFDRSIQCAVGSLTQLLLTRDGVTRELISTASQFLERARYLGRFLPTARLDKDELTAKLRIQGMDERLANETSVSAVEPKRGRPAATANLTIRAVALREQGQSWGQIAIRLCPCGGRHGTRCVDRIKKPALRLIKALSEAPR